FLLRPATPTTEIFTLSLHDALPIFSREEHGAGYDPRQDSAHDHSSERRWCFRSWIAEAIVLLPRSGGNPTRCFPVSPRCARPSARGPTTSNDRAALRQTCDSARCRCRQCP